MRKSNLRLFSINNLFGDRNVQIPFEDDIKILIGENGLGKTTALNILYYTLTAKFYKLKDFDFESIELKFTDDTPDIYICKEDILKYKDIDIEVPSQITNYLSRELTQSNIDEISQLMIAENSVLSIIEKVDKFDNVNSDLLKYYPRRHIYNALKIICGFTEENNDLTLAKKNLLKNTRNTEILYFPTFRRIEEDLINLGLENEKKDLNRRDVRLIQFGMKDVKQRFEELKREIENLSSKGLSKISSDILSQLVKGIPEINNNALQNISEKDIDIILARVGNAISQSDKDRINAIISSKDVDSQIDNKYLIYFLQKLITIYEDQRAIDNSIENFISVCNKYLKFSQKQISYEASEVEFYLQIRDKNRVKLSDILSKLSSGEKQIISLFTKIYLSEYTSFIVLFDEPELSLSIFWQKLLLPDIVNSNRCKLLLSVTHSPFIFDNDLESKAIGLNQYINFN